jgi:hypothetical protein
MTTSDAAPINTPTMKGGIEEVRKEIAMNDAASVPKMMKTTIVNILVKAGSNTTSVTMRTSSASEAEYPPASADEVCMQ